MAVSPIKQMHLDHLKQMQNRSAGKVKTTSNTTTPTPEQIHAKRIQRAQARRPNLKPVGLATHDNRSDACRQCEKRGKCPLRQGCASCRSYILDATKICPQNKWI